MCKLQVIKHGVDRTDLPATLAEEVEQLEGKIASAFRGDYCFMFNGWGRWCSVSFQLVWREGQCEFILYPGAQHQETLVVRAGIENMLGRAGGFLFKLPGREVNITDFRIDLAKGVLSFVGSCSSTHANKRTLRVDLILKDHPELLGLQTFLTSEDDARYRKFKSTILVNDMSDMFLNYEKSDSDSSVDFED